MSYTQTMQANLGASAAGLGTVGYTLYDTSGTMVGARTTSGVAELGPRATGIYEALVTFPDAFNGTIYWDATAAGPVYAAERVIPVSSAGSVTVAGYAGGQDPATLVLDALLVDHDGVGTVGRGIAAAGSAGDPWTTVLPGSYTTPQAGYIVGTYLDTPVSSRAEGGMITIQGPNQVAGFDIALTQGDDYGPDPPNLQRIFLRMPDGTAPDATGGTVIFDVPGLQGSPLACTLVQTGPTGDQLVALDLTATQTAAMLVRRGGYSASAELTTSGGERQTVGRGSVLVRPPVEQP